MDHPAFDPLRQHLIYQMSQNLLRLQLSSLNSPTLPPGTPPSPFINFPSTPTNPSCYFNWPSPLSWPGTPTLPYLMQNHGMVKSEQESPESPDRIPAENRGYSRWWETSGAKDDNARISSGGDSGRGTSETPSSVDTDVQNDDVDDVFVDVVSDGAATTPMKTSPESTRQKNRRLPLKKRPRNLPPLPTIQNPDISSTSTGQRPPMTLPAPFNMPVTPLSIPATPLSVPASPWHLLLQRQHMWNAGTPYSPVGPSDPASPTFFKFPPPPSFLSPQPEDLSRTNQFSGSGLSPESESSALSSLLAAATPEWLESLKSQIAVLPSDSLNLLTDSERRSRIEAMTNLTEDQYNNLRRYLEKRSYSVRDEIGKEDYVPRPIVLRSEFVSLPEKQIDLCKTDCHRILAEKCPVLLNRTFFIGC